jgi:hypothetical protein
MSVKQYPGQGCEKIPAEGFSTKRAMSLWLKDGHEKGGLSDCFAGVFHTSRIFLPFFLTTQDFDKARKTGGFCTIFRKYFSPERTGKETE